MTNRTIKYVLLIRNVGIWRSFVEKYPWLLNWLQRKMENHEVKKRLKKGFGATNLNQENAPSNSESSATGEPGDPDLELTQHPTIPQLAADIALHPTQASLSRRLALSIKKVAHDFRLSPPKRYSYEEWVEFTRLIRLTTPERLDRDLGTTLTEEENEGLVNWDWIGHDSPMMSGLTESEWLMERLCESLVRLEKRKEVACDKNDVMIMREMENREEPGRSNDQAE